MNQIDPITGLPTRRFTTDPITGRPIPVGSNPRVVAPVAFMSQGSPSAYRTYESRGITVDPRSDIEELRALRQSRLDQWANGLGKAGVILGTGVVDNTVGFLAGLGQYAAGGFGSFDEFADDMVNNPVTNLTRAAKDAATEALPNYYTNEEEQSTQLWSANFWADKFLGGAAYTGAAIASAWLTGGTGLATSGAKMGLNAAATGLKGTKAAAAYASGKSMLTSAAARGSKVASGIVEGAQRLPAATSYIESAAAMSMSEAGIEAAETNRAVREKLTQKYMSENGIEDENNIPLAVRQQIELQASQAEGAAFYGNLAVLMPSNLIMFGKMLKPFNPSSTVNPRVVSRVDDAGRVIAADSYATMSKTSRFLNDAATKLAPRVKGAFTELFQEGSQSAIARGLEEFEVDRFYDAGSADMFEALIKGGSLKTLAAASRDIGEAAASSLENKDARESMLIGAIIGFLSGGRAGFSTAKQQDSEAKKAIEMLNDPNFYNLQERAKTTNRSARYSALMEEASERGDMKAYYDYQMLLFQEEAIHHVQNGTYDVFVKRLEDAKNLTDEEFRENFGIAEGVPMDKNKHVEELKSRVEKFVKVVDKINTIYPGTQPPRGAQAMFMSKAKKEAIAEQINDEQLYKSALIRSAALREGLDARIESVINEITELSPNFDVEALNKTRTTNFAEIIGDKIVTPKNEERTKILQDALNNSKTVEDAILLASKTAYLNQLMADRDFVDSAHRNMLLNPQERDLYVQRVKIREEEERQKILDKAVEDAINSTTTVEELSSKQSAFEGVSDAAKIKYQNEITNRKKAEAEVVLEFHKMSKSQVQALDSSNATPLQLKLKDKYLETRNQEEPIIVDSKTKDNTQTEDKAPQAKSKIEPETTQDLQDLVDEASEKIERDIITESKKPPVTTESSLPQIATSTSNTGDPQVKSKGQVLTDVRGKVLVSRDGEPVYSDFHEKRTKNGVALLDLSYLASTEILAGSEVTVEVVEDDWWISNRAAFAGEELQNIPMYIKHNGIYVGVLLASPDNKLRNAVYKAWVSGNNGSVTTEIHTKHVSNIFNAVDADGNIFYYNPVKSLGKDFKIAYLDENGIWKIGKTPDRMGEEDVQDFESELARISTENLTPGQVGLIVTDPNGNKRVLIASTSKISEEDADIAISNIRSMKTANKFLETVGVNIVPSENTGAMYFSENTQNKLAFELIDRDGNPIPLKKTDGNILKLKSEKTILITLTPDAINRLLNGKTLTALEIKELLTTYSVIGETSKGTPIYGLTAVNNSLSQETLDSILLNIESHLKNSILNKRYNVSKDFINNSSKYQIGGKEYDNYLQYLTENRTESAGEPYNGRLRTDSKNVDGSPFFNIGLSLSLDKISTPNVTVAEPVVVEKGQPAEVTPISNVEQISVASPTEAVIGTKAKRSASKKTPATPVTADTKLVTPVETMSDEEIKIFKSLNKDLKEFLDNGLDFEDFLESYSIKIAKGRNLQVTNKWIAEKTKKYCSNS